MKTIIICFAFFLYVAGSRPLEAKGWEAWIQTEIYQFNREALDEINILDILSNSKAEVTGNWLSEAQRGNESGSNYNKWLRFFSLSANIGGVLSILTSRGAGSVLTTPVLYISEKSSHTVFNVGGEIYYQTVNQTASTNIIDIESVSYGTNLSIDLIEMGSSEKKYAVVKVSLEISEPLGSANNNLPPPKNTTKVELPHIKITPEPKTAAILSKLYTSKSKSGIPFLRPLFGSKKKNESQNILLVRFALLTSEKAVINPEGEVSGKYEDMKEERMEMLTPD